MYHAQYYTLSFLYKLSNLITVQ